MPGPTPAPIAASHLEHKSSRPTSERTKVLVLWRLAEPATLAVCQTTVRSCRDEGDLACSVRQAGLGDFLSGWPAFAGWVHKAVELLVKREGSPKRCQRRSGAIRVGRCQVQVNVGWIVDHPNAIQDAQEPKHGRVRGITNTHSMTRTSSRAAGRMTDSLSAGTGR